MLTVILSSTSTAKETAEVLESAGFVVQEHSLGAVPPVDFAGIAVALIDCQERTDAAAAQTRRWRAELGDELVPIVWLLRTSDEDKMARAFDSGADAVLHRPIEAAGLVSQVRSAARTRLVAQRVAARAAEARLLGDQLNKSHARLDRELAAVRRARRALLPQALPHIGGARFAVNFRPRTSGGGDFYDVRHLGAGRASFFLADVVACSTAAGMLGVIAAQAAAAQAAIAPADALAAINRDLLALTADDRPLVAMLAGSLDANSGELVIARAGLPAPVFIPAKGEPEVWSVPGPFLGSADTSYPERKFILRPGDRLVIGTDGMRTDGVSLPGCGDRLLAAAARHHALLGQGLVDAIASDVLAEVRHEDDFTVMAVEMSEARQ